MLYIKDFYFYLKSFLPLLKSASSLCPLIQCSQEDHGKKTVCNLSLHLPQSWNVRWPLAGRQQEPVERFIHIYSRLDHLDMSMTHFQLN